MKSPTFFTWLRQKLGPNSRLDFTNIVQKYPKLRDCRRFRPSRELLSALFSTLMTGYAQIPTTRMPRSNHYFNFCHEFKVNDPYLKKATPMEANIFFAASSRPSLSSRILHRATWRQPLIPYNKDDEPTTVRWSIPILALVFELARPTRKSTWTNRMTTRLAMMTNTTLLFDFVHVLLDWFVLGLHVGFRLSEYAQRSHVTHIS